MLPVCWKAKMYITGISQANEPGLNRCTSLHIQLSSSTWKLESQTHTRSSLIFGKERSEVPGRGKTDGYEFSCQLSVLSCSVPSQFGTGREEGSCFLRNVSYNESYGYKLAQDTRGLNCLVSTLTQANPQCNSDWMMVLWLQIVFIPVKIL